MEFQLNHLQANSTIDNIDQIYSDVTCRVSLLIPNALNDEHSAILNERLEKSMHLRLKLFEPNTDDSNAPADNMSKDNRNVNFKPVGGSKRPVDGSKQSNMRFRRSSETELTEMEIIEGPIRVFRDNFKSGLNASCSLSLRDFDHTFAFNSLINNTIFAPASLIDQNNSACKLVNQGNIKLFFSSFVFMTFFIRWVL